MAFADDLLEQANHLANRDGANARQASLRRAVSTAYYALFHFLIDEAVANWAIGRHRSRLARSFEHGMMKRVCEDQIKIFHSAGRPSSLTSLTDAADAFARLQTARHTVDYDNSQVWTQAEAQAWVDLAAVTFTRWASIRSQPEGEDFLLALFLPKLVRP